MKRDHRQVGVLGFITLAFLVILTGCSNTGSPQILNKPSIDRSTWEKGAIADWTSNPAKNVLDSTGEFGNGWPPCQDNSTLSNYEIGYCDGFETGYGDLVENTSTLSGSGLVRGTDIQLKLPSTVEIDSTCTPQNAKVRNARQSIGNPSKFTNSNEWRPGCIEGYKFELKLQNIYWGSMSAKNSVQEYSQSQKCGKLDDSGNCSYWILDRLQLANVAEGWEEDIAADGTGSNSLATFITTKGNQSKGCGLWIFKDIRMASVAKKILEAPPYNNRIPIIGSDALGGYGYLGLAANANIGCLSTIKSVMSQKTIKIN